MHGWKACQLCSGGTEEGQWVRYFNEKTKMPSSIMSIFGKLQCSGSALIKTKNKTEMSKAFRIRMIKYKGKRISWAGHTLKSSHMQGEISYVDWGRKSMQL